MSKIILKMYTFYFNLKIEVHKLSELNDLSLAYNIFIIQKIIYLDKMLVQLNG